MIEAKLKLKGVPTPIIYQPMYKLIILLAILKYGANKKFTNFLKLHVYMWGIRSAENLKILMEIKSEVRTHLPPWSFEPGLEKTITLCIINNYCVKDIKGGQLKIKLSEEGVLFLNKIEHLEIFTDDISAIKELGQISQDKLDKVNKTWSLK